MFSREACEFVAKIVRGISSFHFCRTIDMLLFLACVITFVYLSNKSLLPYLLTYLRMTDDRGDGRLLAWMHFVYRASQGR
jgi:hypothetical protein